MKTEDWLNGDNKYLYVEAYYEKEFHGFDMLIHKHPYFEIMYVENSYCHVFVQDSTVNSYKINKDQFMIVSPGSCHRLYIPPENKCSMCTLEFKLIDAEEAPPVSLPSLNQLYASCPALKKVILNPKKYEIIHDIGGEFLCVMKRVVDNIERKKNDLSMEDTILAYLECYSCLIALSALYSKIMTSSKSGSYVREAMLILEKQFDQPDFTIDKLSDIIGIHRAYLMNLFVSQTGSTINKYLHELRIKKAAALIKSTDSPLTDICFECGYNNRQNFTSNFKQIMKMSPQEYKNKCRLPDLYVYQKTYQNEWANEND